MEITDEVIEAFREECSGFDDTTIWPKGSVQRALAKADRETGGACWGPYGEGTIKQDAMFAFAQHTLMIKKGVSKAANKGGISTAIGAIQSKTVGDESVTYAVASPNNINDAGTNLLASTTPGQEFIRLRNQVVSGVSIG